jgi:hypothetical protein
MFWKEKEQWKDSGWFHKYEHKIIFETSTIFDSAINFTYDFQNILVCEKKSHCIIILDKFTCKVIRRWRERGTKESKLCCPTYILVSNYDNNNENIYVVDCFRIQIFKKLIFFKMLYVNEH